MKSAASTASRASAFASTTREPRKAPLHPRLHLRGDEPLRQGRRPLRGPSPNLHRHRHAPRRGLPLRPEDFDGETLQVRRTAHEGTILDGTKTDHGEPDAGRIVPVPATLAWMIEAHINLNDPASDLLFTTPSGRLWRERNFYRDIWKPTQKASGLDIRPHECRHSYVTHLRAAGVNDADLAEIAGHRVETMLARYTHAVGHSFGQIRAVLH